MIPNLTFSLDESRQCSVELTGARTAQAPAAQLARLRRAGAGQAAPPGPVRFGSGVVENHQFLSCWIFQVYMHYRRYFCESSAIWGPIHPVNFTKNVKFTPCGPI